MNINCYDCGSSIELGSVVPREEECPNCRNEVKVCMNCIQYDPASYNECRESNAERIVEKDRRNFCDYFKAGRDSKSTSSEGRSKDDLLKDLDSLFKK